MEYQITEYDKELMTQNVLNYKYKINVLNTYDQIIDTIEEFSSIGDYSIDSESSVRRSASFSMIPQEIYRNDIDKLSIEQKLFGWIGCDFELLIGIQDLQTNEIKYYKCGRYTITESNTTYSATENSITFNLSDLFSNLNGTKNGQIGGAYTIQIKNVDENNNPVSVRFSMMEIVKQSGVKKYIISDIGEQSGLQEYNPNWSDYRKSHPEWNQLPHDLSFGVGSTYGDIINEINSLFPYTQVYYDVYDNLCYNLIPSGLHTMTYLDNSFIQKILLSESTESVSYNVSDIKNVTQVFGKDYDVDYYIDVDNELELDIFDYAKVSYSKDGNNYHLTYELDSTDTSTTDMISYEKYEVGDVFCIKIKDTNNMSDMTIQINDLEKLNIVDQSTGDKIKQNLITANEFHNFMVGFESSIDGTASKGNYIMYYLGQYQPMATCILSDGSRKEKYNIEYFSKKYNCKKQYIKVRIDEESPFSIEKIGEILDVKSGDSFDSIYSSSMALYNAEYYNKLSTTMKETITLHTKMIPFLDVNQKVSYKKANSKEENEYIIKSITNNLDSMTSSITMYRFNPFEYNLQDDVDNNE